MKMGPLADWRGFFADIVKLGGEEFLGEGTSSAITKLTDYLALGDKSSYEARKRQYQEEKQLSREAAAKAAFLDEVEEVLFDAFGGFASGSISASAAVGGETAKQYVQKTAKVTDAESYARRLQEVMPEFGVESGLVGMGSKFAAEKKQMGHEDGKALDSPEWKEISVAGGKTNTKFRMQKIQKTIDQEVMLKNPGYKNGGPEYRQNCQRCVAAYVMRKRGYDVIAKPAVVDENGELSSKDPMSKKWKHIFVDTEFQFYTGYDGGKEEIISQMSKWEEGAVAEIRVMWDSKHAHVFVAEKIGDAIRFVDPQKGICNCEHYFTDAIIGGTIMARIDGHEPTELIELCIMNRGGRE